MFLNILIVMIAALILGVTYHEVAERSDDVEHRNLQKD